MKHLKLVVALMLVTVMAVSLGFAGKANGGSVGPVREGAATQLQKVTNDPDLQGTSFKSAANRVTRANIEATSVPVVRLPIDKAAARTTFSGGLSGTYTIPGSFSSISNAVAVLNFVGVSGNTVFELGSASYTELAGITFGSYPGNDSFSVTVKPAAGVAATVNFQPSASEGKGFAFNGAKNVTIDGVNAGGASLTLKYSGGTFPAGDAFGATVYITGGSNNIAVRKTSIEGQIVGPYATQTEGRPAVFVWFGSADPAGNSNITVDSCTISKATYGIKALCEDLVASGPMSFTHNQIGGAFGSGVPVNQAALTDAVSGLHYDHNDINGIQFNDWYWNNGPTEYDLVATFGGSSFLFDFGQPSGGHVYNSNSTSTIAYNNVTNITQPYGDGFAFIIYGLLCRVGSGPIVHDNRIQGPITTIDTDGTMVGLRSEAQAWHNSIRMTGTMTAGQTSYAMRAAGGTCKNNAFSNEMTGASASRTRALQGTPAGVSDGNAMYSNGQISSQSTLAGYLATGQDGHSAFGPIGFDASLHIPAGPSAAEDVGIAHLTLAADVDGTVRDTTNAGVRDAGADDFGPTGSPLGNDALPVLISSPSSAGVPVGLAQTPVVRVKNNSPVAQIFNVKLEIPLESYSDTKSISLGAHESGNVTFASWTPLTAVSHTVTATSMLAGDVTAGNDVLSRAQSVSTPDPITTSKLYTWDAGDESWTRSNDWVRSSSFTKLTGPYAGASMVTQRPDNAATYTEGSNANSHGYAAAYPGANILTSPFLDLSPMTGDSLYISFFQSIKAEVQWDISWMEYSTDGVNWHHLGHLNDPKGVNWYSTAVYNYAAAGSGNPPDTVTMDLYGITPGGGNDQTFLLDFPIWSSNGDPSDAVPVGPTGYVFNQLKVNLGDYPGLIHAPIIKFRYVAFSDASAAFEGWAVDNFRLANTGTILAGGSITGHAYQDLNGNGVDDAEPLVTAGTKVYISYFGALKDSTTIDGSGNYSYNIGANGSLPGVYNIRLAVPGVGFTVPFGTSGIADVNHPSDLSTKVQNFGTFVGSISGKKYSDVNDNGANDSEPGLAGWTIVVHRDSLTGALVGSQVTDVNGNYSFNLPPATYVVSEVAQPTIARQTAPAGGKYTEVVAAPSGGGSAVITGKDFGNFLYYKLRINLTVDLNGDGVVQGGDVLPLPAVVGTISVFTTKKNGSTIFVDTLGNGVASVLHDSLDVGTYDVLETAFTPGWLRTKGGTFTHIVATSGVNDTARFMDFKYLTISGHKFNDINGNGINDTEPGLAGWTINVSGNGLGSMSAVTDSLGAYSIDSVTTGLHVITETGVAGWSQTVPTPNYSFTAISGNLPNPVNNRDFGNFQNYSISGRKFIDRNNNGTKDPEDNGLSGWTIILSPNADSVRVTDANGDYSFTDVGPGAKTLSEVAQLGWVQSAPALGTYAIVGVSGTNVTDQDFGNFKSTDSTAYRTFTAAQLQGDSEKKPVKKPKAGKPILSGPNTGNLVADILAQAGVIKVGLAGQLNAGGKEKAYIQPVKQGDLWKSLNAKSVFHTGAARGLDLDVKGKLILKRLKALPPTKKNSTIIANLLALQVNLAASGLKTPAGLGALMYNEAGHALNGWSIDSIANYADGIMTNWEGVSYDKYVMLDSVAAKINAAFATGSVSDTTTGGGWTSAKLQWVASTTVIDVPFLKATGNPAQTRRGTFTPEPIPTEFALQQNYPNPFNPTTTIQFDLANQSLVTLKIYNMLGQEVATLLNREDMSAGTEELEFDASSLASGVYLYRVVAETVNDDGAVSQTYTQVKKMVLLK